MKFPTLSRAEAELLSELLHAALPLAQARALGQPVQPPDRVARPGPAQPVGQRPPAPPGRPPRRGGGSAASADGRGGPRADPVYGGHVSLSRTAMMVQPTSPLRVLVVEDCPDTSDTSRLLLELWGHDVLVAPDADTALTLAWSFRPQAVLINVGRAGPAGFGVARRLREVPRHAAPALVAATGPDTRAVRVAAPGRPGAPTSCPSRSTRASCAPPSAFRRRAHGRHRAARTGDVTQDRMPEAKMSRPVRNRRPLGARTAGAGRRHYARSAAAVNAYVIRHIRRRDRRRTSGRPEDLPHPRIREHARRVHLLLNGRELGKPRIEAGQPAGGSGQTFPQWGRAWTIGHRPGQRLREPKVRVPWARPGVADEAQRVVRHVAAGHRD